MKSFAGKKSAARHSDPLQPGHVVQFYTREQFMIDEVARRTARALRSRIPAVLVATEKHLQNFEVRLGQLGLPVDRLRDRHLYVTFDASETLHTFMDGLLPDRERFDRVIGGLIKEAAGLSPTGLVSIFGEMVALLCAAGNIAGAIALEELWNELAGRFRFSLCCAYPLELFGADSVGAVFSICEQHTLCLPAEGPL